MKAFLVAVFTLAATPSLAQSVADEIAQANQHFVQAINTGDVTLLPRVYTDHGLILPPNHEIVAGREAIEQYWRTVTGAGLRILSLRSVRIDELAPDAASEVGRFTIETTELLGRTEAMHGKYVVVWRKSGGAWRHDSEIWNFSDPPRLERANALPDAPVVR